MEPIDQGESGEQLAITEALDKQAIVSALCVRDADLQGHTYCFVALCFVLC